MSFKKTFLKFYRDYFDFSKAERNVFFLLVLLIIGIIAVPIVFKPQKYDKTDFMEFENHSNIVVERSAKFKNEEKKSYPSYSKFDFNPNDVSYENLLKLGFKPYTANKIINARTKGFVFRTKKDLAKIYSIDTVLVKSLYAFIQLPETIVPNQNTYTKGTYEKSVYQKPELIDVNSADTALLNRLPGIGNILSARIVAYRDKLGGFNSLTQLGEVYGLKPEVIEKISPKITLDLSQIKLININTASISELSQHPYIKKRMAEIIVNYRNQHGLFSKPQDLLKTQVIQEQELDKFSSYLKF